MKPKFYFHADDALYPEHTTYKVSVGEIELGRFGIRCDANGLWSVMDGNEEYTTKIYNGYLDIFNVLYKLRNAVEDVPLAIDGSKKQSDKDDT